MSIALEPLDERGLRAAQRAVTESHYLHAPVDSRSSVEGYAVLVGGAIAGYLLVGRPEAQRCYPWYGAVSDVATGRAEMTRWQVLNLARVWLDPVVQAGGAAYAPDRLPGFWDRKGAWHSTLASTAIGLLVTRVGYEYLLRRPPCFMEEPYAIRALLSYCDPARHRGTLYRAAGFTLARTNKRGLQTYRLALPPLTPGQDATIRRLAGQHPRSIAYRTQRTAAATTAQGLLL